MLGKVGTFAHFGQHVCDEKFGFVAVEVSRPVFVELVPDFVDGSLDDLREGGVLFWGFCFIWFKGLEL